jgi:hypothetical protein
MPTCALTGVELTRDIDSEAHIIPSALGGHLRPRGLLSREANNTLSRKVDQPLIEVLGPLASLLGATRDRGELQPLHLKDSDGGVWRYEFSQPLRPRDPQIKAKVQHDGSVRICVIARHRRRLRQKLKQAARNYPGLDLRRALDSAEDVCAPGNVMLQMELDFDEQRTLPACWSMLVLFAYYKTGWLHPLWRGYIDALDREQPEPPPATHFLASSTDWFEDPHAPPICHRLILKGSAYRGLLFGFVELFGTLCVAAILSEEWQSDCEHVYVWDVVGGRTVGGLRVPGGAWENLPRTNPVTGELGHFFEARTRRLFEIALGRQHEASTERQIREAIRVGLHGMREGDEITTDAVRRIAREVGRRLIIPRIARKRGMRRP